MLTIWLRVVFELFFPLLKNIKSALKRRMHLTTQMSLARQNIFAKQTCHSLSLSKIVIYQSQVCKGTVDRLTEPPHPPPKYEHVYNGNVETWTLKKVAMGGKIFLVKNQSFKFLQVLSRGAKFIWNVVIFVYSTFWNISCLDIIIRSLIEILYTVNT